MEGRQLAQLCNKALPAKLGGCGSATLETGMNAIGSLIGAIIGVFLIFAFILAMFYLLTGGIQWITSGGDKGKLQAARDKIIQAILGLIIVAAIWAIMTLVGKFIGIQFPVIPFPTVTGTEALQPVRMHG
ncbi:hypothetical protein A2Z33_07630 [Candidatus Gottesmanbacteria bacterium RBG_16_52_11]|uniref:Uncharacterized protein n=1 Tax=Candidatus Gottesmanbacteria bacterium RBG_16_52_11 TaxID=1798374 RepID=A0A1F5YN60_9BACT|nr:MAG: hypothetical protein A2Z33_07630 [Candidatus Gottesmanbacteria bacterium RBG_16_52_11]